MSQRDMQHQATVDSGVSATDGYSPAGEVPPPATRLLDLPPALLDDIACRVMQLGARSLLPLTCCAFSQARLLHVPALHIQLGRQCCDQLLTPRVVAALQARTSKLALTLEQPETVDSRWFSDQLAPTLQLLQTEYTQDYTDLLAHALAKLGNCAAVEVCSLVSSGQYTGNKRRYLHCPPGLAQHLLGSFPSLTALTLQGLCVSSNELASLLPHSSLALQLQRLHLTDISFQDGDEGAVGLTFQGLQLKQLSIAFEYPGQRDTLLLPSFQPLAQHLTQLHLARCKGVNNDLSDFMKYLQPLAQLQVLTLSHLDGLEGLTELLQALPQLHTLQLPEVNVTREQKLDALLAATQITSLQLREVNALDTSYADAPCSWQRLELTFTIAWKAITYLPLHSLSQPLVLGHLLISEEDISDPEVAAAIHLLAYACKVPVQIKKVLLWVRSEKQLRTGPTVLTPTILQQQRVDLAQLVAMLQPLQCCCSDKVSVRNLDEVTAADVQALAPLCRDCTHFELDDGSVEPSLGFWHQLVQLMPAVQKPAASLECNCHYLQSGSSTDDAECRLGASPLDSLLDLPPALLDDIACRVMQLGARSLLLLTCRAFSQARLLYVPALHIQLGRQCCDQLLTPRVVAALQARTSKLALTLWQPKTEDSECYIRPAGPHSAKVGQLCSSGGLQAGRHYMRSPSWTQGALRTLDLSQGARLKRLIFDGYCCHPLSSSRPPVPNLQPLAQHLTELHLKYYSPLGGVLVSFMDYLQPLAQLQVLTLDSHHCLQGLPALLQALPQLHTLQLPGSTNWGQQELDTLLAATQLTSIQLELGGTGVRMLDTTYADAPCSWQRVEPQVLNCLNINVDDISNPEVAAALHNMAHACKVPVKIKSMRLYMLTAEEQRSGVITPALLQQQRVDLAQLVAMLQPLQCCGEATTTLLRALRGPAGCSIGTHRPQAHRPARPTARKSSEAPVGVASEWCFSAAVIHWLMSEARLLHIPALRIQLGRQCCDQLLTPRVVAALQARKSKLALTLWLPVHTRWYEEQLAPTLQLQKTEYTQHYTDLLAHALAKLGNCAAVEVCKLVCSVKYEPNKRKQLCCSPGLAQHLLDSFPSLTALTLQGLSVSSDALASLLSHPPLALQLQQLHLTHIFLQDGEELGAVGSVFEGLQLQQLSIAVEHREQPGSPLLPSFQPLAQHLTQLHLVNQSGLTTLSAFMEYLQPLAQLQVLTMSYHGPDGLHGLEGLPRLLQALPLLHTLQLPMFDVGCQHQLDTLLAATQLTSLQLGAVNALDTSYADVPCSWQRLELTGCDDWKALTYLPLHSLSQPLVLGLLQIRVEDISDPEVAAAIHLLAYAIKVPVQIKVVQLIMLSREQLRIGPRVFTPTLLQQQRVDLAQQIAVLQPLQRCFVDKVVVCDLYGVTAVDVLALAPLCRDCTHFVLDGGSIEPSLGFWRQLVQLMPAVQQVEFANVEGCASAAMHESLQLMAEQPWARWLHVTIRYFSSSQVQPGAAARSHQAAKERSLETQPGVVAWRRKTRKRQPYWGRRMPAAESQGQHTVLAMSQSDMQYQVTVDGGASATDGYSPAGQAPTPGTTLLDLPPALLADIACRFMQLGARSLLHLTCRAFSQAHLLHVPALRIQLGRQCCDQLLTPRVVAALQARTSKLALTLWQPETEDSECYKEQLAPTLQLPQTEYTQDYTDLLAHALAKLDNCAAVEACKLVCSGKYKPNNRKHMRCRPGLAQHLLDSFPSLTALTLQGLCVSSEALASLLSHPPLALQLHQLHLTDICASDDDELTAVGTLFQGLQLQQLSIAAEPREQPGSRLLPSFQPLAQHLTQLHLVSCDFVNTDLSEFVEYLQPMAQLQVLTIPHLDGLEGLTELLQALPQLHTLQLPAVTVWEQDLDTLLAATQITSLLLDSVEALDTSYADAPCSWQRLELTGWVRWKAITNLPLHSLAQPLVLGQLVIRVEDISDPEVAATLHLLAYAIKVPVQIKVVQLNMMSREQMQTGPNVISPALLQQQRVDLAQLVALLQPLQCCCVGKVQVCDLHGVTTADVLALAPLCRDCAHFELYGGSIEPSLDFWYQLVQLMPAVQEVKFIRVEGCVSAAMHESLQLMAEQPWARWLHVKIRNYYSVDAPPACWQANSWLKTGIIKVSMCNDRLLDLPPALLDDIACQVMQLGARSQLPLTCRAFSLARLLHVPALRIQLGRQCCDQLLTPRVVAALQARTSKLALTLWQPKTEDSELYTNQLAHTLPKLNKCAAVEVCRLVGNGSDYRHGPKQPCAPELGCSPDMAQRLVDSFPGLTTLVLSCHSVTCGGLASLLSHPQLSLQLQQLELHSITVQQLQQPVSGAVTLDLFQGARLKQLKLEGFRCHPSVSRPPLPNLQPLAQHLTQLHLKYYPLCGESPEFFVEYLQPLAQLHVLTLSHLNKLQGLTELLQALPQLHTLQLPGTLNWGQQELGTLLAATQITSLQLELGWTGVERLNTSRADAPCSWQRLELLGTIDWKAVAYLPLHSLSQPLVLNCLNIGVEDISNPEVAAALHNMACACKVPVKIKSMRLYMLNAKERRCGVITPALLQQQRVDLAQLVALLQPLQCCCVDKVMVYGLHEATAADVLALAPLCRDCTHFKLWGGSIEPSLEFWCQLVQLMPAVQKVEFAYVEGCASAAMHESLQLMAEQPWARWLHVTIRYWFATASELPACWQANSWLKIFKVTMDNDRPCLEPYALELALLLLMGLHDNPLWAVSMRTPHQPIDPVKLAGSLFSAAVGLWVGGVSTIIPPSYPGGQAQRLAGGQQGSGSKPSSQVGTRAAVLAWPDHVR
ncbi:hypothetical protein QJQ45_024882 [Haematococcus lacustris]|nr:hypothetical protein QJQ45_024882 [Haematococcus lacustris]